MRDATEDTLRAQIVDAFGYVAAPPADDMLQQVYRDSEDAYEMMTAFRGKHWTELPISVLSHHREIIIALTGVGYRAYLPAYLTACLANDETYGADVRGYTLYGLRPLSTSEVHVATGRERLSLLDAKQRAAVAAVLGYLEETWRMKEAGDVLRAGTW
jgi:hypothetical protein